MIDPMAVISRFDETEIRLCEQPNGRFELTIVDKYGGKTVVSFGKHVANALAKKLRT